MSSTPKLDRRMLTGAERLRTGPMPGQTWQDQVASRRYTLAPTFLGSRPVCVCVCVCVCACVCVCVVSV
jgi:hypothetical protein